MKSDSDNRELREGSPWQGGEGESFVAARLTGITQVVLGLAIATAIVFLAASVFVEGRLTQPLWAVVAALPAFFVLLALVKRGYARWAAIGTVVVLYLIMIAVVLSRGTVRVPATAFVIVATALSGLVLSRNSMYLTLASGILAIGGLALAESVGLLSLSEPIPLLPYWVAISALALTTGLIISYGRDIAEDALGRAAEEIAERRRAEWSLRKSEARFRSLNEMSSDFYWESDAGHRITRRGLEGTHNRVSLFRRSAQLGERRWEVPYLSPDAAGWEAHRATLDAHQPFRDFQLSRPGSDGREHFVTISGEPLFDASGAFTGYRGVGTDITERKRAEKAMRDGEHRYRTMFNSAPMGVWLIGPDRRTVEVNHRFCDLLGYLPEEILGKEPTDFADDENRKIFEAAARLIPNRRKRNYEVALRHRDGHNIPTELHATNLFNEDGSLMAVLAFVTELTERKRQEEELRRLNDELEQRVAARTHDLEIANRELESFSYSVSHDLRAPLRAIDGFCKILLEEHTGQLDAQGRRFLGRVSDGAVKMAELIDSLLKLSRISRQEMQITRVDLSALVREIADDLAANSPVRAVEWVVAPEVQAEGDRDLLKVALRNLISNAWKYTSKLERTRIEFGLDERNGHAAYFVRDNGAGFDMAYASKLFGAFQRLHSPSEFPGTGIGLATVARIVHRHGGEVWGEARVGEGATFYFTV